MPKDCFYLDKYKLYKNFQRNKLTDLRRRELKRRFYIKTLMTSKPMLRLQNNRRIWQRGRKTFLHKKGDSLSGIK